VLILRTELAAHRGKREHDRHIASLDPARRAGEQRESVSPDLLGAMVHTFAGALAGMGRIPRRVSQLVIVHLQSAIAMLPP
jgi:hypothetical protein